MAAPLDILRAAYADPYAAARAHRAAGGKVVGYLLNSVPEELITASGCFPVRLRGEPTRRSVLADRYIEEYMDGEVRSIFGALLDGRFDFIDLLVIPRNSEVYLQLYYFLLEIPKWESRAPLPPIYLFDLLQTPSSTTLRYVVGRLHAFAQRLEALTGRPISSDALSAALEATNAKRTLQQKASALWQSVERRLDGADALAVISSAAFMRANEYQDAVAALIAQPPAPLPPRPRLLLKGSPQSDARFTTLVEKQGGAIVAHDHLWGDRTYAPAVRSEGEPWTALAQHYCFETPSPREYPQTKADARFLALATRARVDGVIFFHDEWDDTLGWEYPDQKKLLDQHGIASLFLKRQPYFAPDEAALNAAVLRFLERLRVPA